MDTCGRLVPCHGGKANLERGAVDQGEQVAGRGGYED